MSTGASPNSPATDPFTQELDRLSRRDNTTNLLYVGRAWLILALAIGGFVAFDLGRAEAGGHVLWDLPLLLVAIVVVGASQHQLAGVGHEATHYSLFRNRTFNGTLSDWLCMYPILTSTSSYRKQHLAHHQHVNDPEHDPDLAQLKASGHAFDFPIPAHDVVQLFLGQLWLPKLVRYMLYRARYSAVGMTETHEAPGHSVPRRLFFPYFFILSSALALLAHFEFPVVAHILTTAIIAGMAALAILVAHRRARPEAPDTSEHSLQRYGHVTTVLLTLTLVHVHTGLETLTYYGLLWLLPLVTSFSYFMMLRQTIQHGNCDSGRFTNTRVFLVNPLVRYAVFPFGMDYHLPHHLYASVPHYRLHALHELLQAQPAYQRRGIVVSGCFDRAGARNGQANPGIPSVIGALGADYTLNENDHPTSGKKRVE